jgi:hypothetical protein
MKTTDVLLGAALGCAATLLLDPNSGGRRRALMRDKMTRATRRSREGLDAAARDISNRAAGIAATVRQRGNGSVSDDTIIERVRARLGRVCSHPHAIDVYSSGGTVTLRGPILTSEIPKVLKAAGSARGVREVINELEPHISAEGIPSLQGEGRVAAWDLAPRRWSPATKTLVGAGVVAGAVMAAQRSRHQIWH